MKHVLFYDSADDVASKAPPISPHTGPDSMPSTAAATC